MAATSYIPSKDADFENWLNNFSTLLTASPVTYGLTAPDAVIVAGQYASWNAAYMLATNPATRTSVTIQAKTNARNTATATVRPYAVNIINNAGVTDANKTSIGVTVPKLVPTPVPPPLTFPHLVLDGATPLVMNMSYRDSGTPTSKKKPAGATGVQIFVTKGIAPAVDPSVALFYQTWTKSPNTVNFNSGDTGKIATFFTRYQTTSGPGGTAQYGPWGTPQSWTII